MSKRILLVTGNFLPGKNGGIENYVFWLAGILKKQNFVVEVAALHVLEKKDYEYEGIKVHYLNKSLDVFIELLKTEIYNICHFHEYSENGGIEIPWLKKAKEHCSKVFFTFHLPYLTCYKNDFRYKGVEDCHTFNDPARCAECIIAEKMKNAIGSILASVATMSLMNIPGVKNNLVNKVALKHHYLNELILTCDDVFLIADWFKKILFDNGYRNSNIHKIPNKPAIHIEEESMADNSTFKKKILFIGRIQHQKGLHLLCKAMHLIEDKNIELDVYGNRVEESYFEICVQKYTFNYKGTTERETLMNIIKDYDFLVLPSVFTEMYPLVIMDALHRHLPVIASAAKGNKEVIINEENGFLFDYDNAKDLAKTIDKAYSLKRNGWSPTFRKDPFPENEMNEIFYYYGEVEN